MFNIYIHISSFIYDYPGRNKYFVSLHFSSNDLDYKHLVDK